MEALSLKIVTRCSVRDDTSYAALNNNDYCMVVRLLLLTFSFQNHVENQGLCARDDLATLPFDDRVFVFREFAKFCVSLVVGLSLTQAGYDSNNHPVVNLVLAIDPLMLLHIATQQFIKDIVDMHRAQHSKIWFAPDIDNVETERRELDREYGNFKPLMLMIGAQEGHGVVLKFNDVWNAIKGRLTTLRDFCAALVTALPNTTSVEAPILVLKW